MAIYNMPTKIKNREIEMQNIGVKKAYCLQIRWSKSSDWYMVNLKNKSPQF